MQTRITTTLKKKIVEGVKKLGKAFSRVVIKPDVIVLTLIALIINQVFSPFFRIDIKTLQQFLSIEFIKASFNQLTS